MELCPICIEKNCIHAKKFIQFGVTKLHLMGTVVDTAINVFSALMIGLPIDASGATKIADALKNLKEAKEKLVTVTFINELKA